MALNSTDRIIEYLDSIAKIAKSMPITDIDRAIDLLFDTWKDNHTVYVLGNGGSGSTAGHFACDLAKSTVVEGRKRFRVMGLADSATLLMSWINDESVEATFVEQLKPFLMSGDLVVGISVHGASGCGTKHPWSRNVLLAMEYARQKGAKTLALTGFDGGALKALCDVSVVVPCDSIRRVEDYHLVLCHIFADALRERIADSFVAMC